MLEMIMLLFRAITPACRGHQDIILESLALRHQLRTLHDHLKIRRPRRPEQQQQQLQDALKRHVKNR